MIIKDYKDFKNLILEKTNEDDPFASIEKQIKGASNKIKNRLTKDGVVIEKGKFYFILIDDNTIIKKVLMGKEEGKQFNYRVVNDSNVGKYPKDKMITGTLKVFEIKKTEIYYNIDKLIKKYPDFKTKRPLILQQQYIKSETNDKQKNNDNENQEPKQNQEQQKKEPIDNVKDVSKDGVKGGHESQVQDNEELPLNVSIS